MRGLVKAAVESMAVHSGLTALGVRLRGGRTLVLCYHNVVPQGQSVDGDRSLHLGFDDFRRQMDRLQESGDVVPLATVLDPGGAARPRYVITFDDAYRGAITLALPELELRGLPSTVFVAPGLLGDEGFWWDRVPISGWDDPAPLGELRGETGEILRWAGSRGLDLRRPPPLQRPCTSEELASVPIGGMTLGCHTWSHPNLARLRPDEVRAELGRGLEWLRGQERGWVPWIAYPYGLASAAVREVATELGFEGGLRVEGGWIPGGPSRFRDPLDIPRFNIPAGLSVKGFRMLLAGLRG